MTLTATDAKNRFGQMLEEARKGPVFIEKAGRRHSVVMSVEHYDRLVGAAAAAEAGGDARRFAEKYKDWVDEEKSRFERLGVWNEELRPW